MCNKSEAIDVLIIGAGMIVHDLILPAVYQQQRMGIVADITICGTRIESINKLKNNTEISEAFPGQDFKSFPNNESNDDDNSERYKKVLKSLKKFSLVIIAIPDQLHYQVVMESLDCNQHILCVKPLVLNYRQSLEIEQKAYDKGCFIGIEYHKRFDRRSLLAKKYYSQNKLGEFVIGEAKLIEPYFYRLSNFQNWFTCDETDPFVYVGCHYVDLVYFITNLKPIEVSVAGVKRKFPNGKEAYMWSSGRVRFENNALLSVTNGLGYPDAAAGSNEQCLSMFFEKENKACNLFHDDQYRGVEYAFADDSKAFRYINPDFFQFVPWEGAGLKPVGYGVDSVVATISKVATIEKSALSNTPSESLAIRQKHIKKADQQGFIATPANSSINELVHEAARLSIVNGGDNVEINYNSSIPSVSLKHNSKNGDDND